MGEPSGRAVEYRAPSFSWASIDGAVSPSSVDGSKPLTRILDVNLEYLSDDTTGLIKSGSLVLECDLHKVTLTPNPHPKLHHLFIMTINGKEVRQPDGPEWERSGPVLTLDDEVEVFDPSKSEDIYLLPARIWEDEKPMLTILLLELVDRAEATYRRIGIANAPKEIEIEMLTRPDDEAASLPALFYQSGRHSIRLV